MKVYKNIDECIFSQKEAFQKPLQDLRTFIHQLVPESIESISYGMPTFKVRGKAFAGFNGYKSFMSFYPFGGEILKEFREELKDFECEKSAIHFTPENIIPKELLTKIILRRIEMIPKK